MINVRETRVYRSIEVDGALIPARLEVPFVVVLMRTCSTSASTATIVRTDHRRRCPPGRETAERQTKRERAIESEEGTNFCCLRDCFVTRDH